MLEAKLYAFDIDLPPSSSVVSVEYLLLSQVEQSVLLPRENLPAGQGVTPVRSDVGLKPAGVDLQEEAPLTSLYCPSPSHCLQV
jgi:hypothetical protein